MSIANRLKRLEKQQGESAPLVVRVYYHDREKGYSARAAGPYFGTFDELATAQGWAPRESDVNIAITYASQGAVYIPDNGRANEQN